MTHDQPIANAQHGFHPYAFFPEDLDRMEVALGSALFALRHSQIEADSDKAARLVLRLYRMGLTDAEKLAVVAARLLYPQDDVQ